MMYELCGYVKYGGENLSFALPIYKGEDNLYYIQMLSEQESKKGMIDRFVVQEDLGSGTKYLEFIVDKLGDGWVPVQKCVGEKGVFIFVDHNGLPVINESEKIDYCLRRVFSLLAEPAAFLGKWSELKASKIMWQTEYLDEVMLKDIFGFLYRKSSPSAIVEAVCDVLKKGVTLGEISRNIEEYENRIVRVLTTYRLVGKVRANASGYGLFVGLDLEAVSDDNRELFRSMAGMDNITPLSKCRDETGYGLIAQVA